MQIGLPPNANAILVSFHLDDSHSIIDIDAPLRF
jgi:hypothetical protein